MKRAVATKQQPFFYSAAGRPTCGKIIHAQHKFQEPRSSLESSDLLLVFLFNFSNIFLEI